MFEHAITVLFSLANQAAFQMLAQQKYIFFSLRITVDNLMQLGREGIFYNLTQRLHPLEDRMKEASLAY